MADLLLHVGFVFAVLGTKLLLALWAIYYLLPGGGSCPECNAETLPLQMGWPRRVAGALLFLGRVRRRWCPACAWDGFVRPSPPSLRLRREIPSPDSADRTL
ncbi:MAG: hypothetical protein ABR599_12525 [Gemmatimonadota bacterium]